MAAERIAWLAGCWDLVEVTFTGADGGVLTPWGDSPVGVLIVTPSGALSAHGGRSDRAPFAGAGPTPAEKQQVYDDYFSYFARIVDVDDVAGTIVNAVDGATDPGWIGSEQLRYLDIVDDDHLTLRTPDRSRRSRGRRAHGVAAADGRSAFRLNRCRSKKGRPSGRHFFDLPVPAP